MTLRIRYGWLATHVPQIFDDGWRSWLDNLSKYETSNLRMNRSGLVHYRRVIVDRLFKREVERIHESLFDPQPFDDTLTTSGR